MTLFRWVFVFTFMVTALLFTYLLVKTPPLPGSGSGGVDTAAVRIAVAERRETFGNFSKATDRLSWLSFITSTSNYLLLTSS